jgi:signal transduction histidine kinase
MSDIVLPLYLALALVFMGNAVASWPGQDRRLLPGERANWLGVLGGIFAAISSFCIALVPHWGRFLLPISTMFTWFCLLATCLRIRSWRTAVSNTLQLQSFAVMLAICLLMIAQFLIASPQWQRVVFQMGLTWVLLCWMLFELRRLMLVRPSLQLNLMAWSGMCMALVVLIWSWSLVSPDFSGLVLEFTPLFSEAAWAFSMRLFLVATLVLLLTGANGYGAERLVGIKTELNHQFIRTQALNRELQQAIHEKNEMLQTLSFAVRSKNLPAIASSLTHEINQPLGAIRLNLDYLMAEGDQMTSDDRRDVMEQMLKCSEASNEVVVNFRRFFEVESNWKLFDVQSLLIDLMYGLRTDFLRKGVQVTLLPGPPVWIQGDSVQFETAVAGVMEHMTVEMCEVCSRLQVDCSVVGSAAVLRMMSEDEGASKDLFQQAFDQSKEAQSGSFSPGLWLTRAIVEHHGGAMSICEDKGRIGFALQIPFSSKDK